MSDNADFTFAASNDNVFVQPLVNAPPYINVAPSYTSGTASYTLVLYGT